MFYYYLRYFNWFFAFFGIKKPFPGLAGEPNKMNLWDKLWAVFFLLISIIICSFGYEEASLLKTTNTFKTLLLLPGLGNLIYNTFANLLFGEKVCINLYMLVQRILHNLRLSHRSVKLMAMKIGIFITFLFALNTITIMYAYVLAVYEPKNLIERPYFFTSIFLVKILYMVWMPHFLIHLCVLLAILRVLNQLLHDLVSIDHGPPKTLSPIEPSKLETVKYVLCGRLRFTDIKRGGNWYDVAFLCKIYDDIGACMHLLEKHHGFQMLLMIWKMFSGTVIIVTLYYRNELAYPKLAMVLSAATFCWFLLACYLDDMIQREVDRTETLLVKCLIDFRCDPTRKAPVQIFKEVINSNRLQFTACSVFRLNYGVVVGIVVNVITYSIICIQLLINS